MVIIDKYDSSGVSLLANGIHRITHGRQGDQGGGEVIREVIITPAPSHHSGQWVGRIGIC